MEWDSTSIPALAERGPDLPHSVRRQPVLSDCPSPLERLPRSQPVGPIDRRLPTATRSLRSIVAAARIQNTRTGNTGGTQTHNLRTEKPRHKFSGSTLTQLDNRQHTRLTQTNVPPRGPSGFLGVTQISVGPPKC